MQKNIKLTLVLVFILSYSIFYYVHNNDKQERIEHELNNKLNDLKVHYSLTLDYFYTDAKSVQSNFTNNKKIINALKNAYNNSPKEQAILRNDLYKYILPLYKRIHTRGILQVHFVFPNNRTFLRVHKPQKFGDDLSKVRYSYKYVNDTKKITYGFEQGKTVHSIRYVFPMFDEKKNHIGAAEISLSTKYLQDRLQSSNKLHTHYIVNKNIFEVKAWKERGMSAKYIQSVESKDYLYTLTSHNYDKLLRAEENKYLADKRSEIDNKIKSQKAFSMYVKTKDSVKVLSFLPIRNIKDKKVVAYLVAHTNSYVVSNILKDSYRILIVAFFAMLILFYSLYKTIRRREQLSKEVYKKTKELKELNENLEERIEEEVLKNQKVQEQLFKSEKMASMGEMIGNIAHQWRQPLSVISLGATGMKLHKEYGTLADEEFFKTCDTINDNAQYLSNTIDDFNNFIKGDRKEETFNLKENINSFLQLVDGSIKSNHISVIVDVDDNIEIKGYSSELKQCFINIFNNSRDAFLSINEKNRYLFITVSVVDNKIYIVFRDNGGGIPENILPKIFEPYFTTKHQSQGTGLGLHMSYTLISDGMNGTIDASNKEYIYDDISYTGAVLTITLSVS